MHLEITKPGLQTTIQDKGRYGWMHMGFSHAGAMDPLAMIMANKLVARPTGSPVLEFSLVGPDIIFHGDFQIAITGADCLYELNAKPVAMYTTIHVRAGDKLIFKVMTGGCRGYIAFRQPMQVSSYLDSVSTHLTAGVGGLDGKMLKAGDAIKFSNIDATPELSVIATRRPKYHGNYRIRITPSPETEWFAKKEQLRLTETMFRISKNLNRMGVRLDNELKLESNLPEMRSRGLLPGAIQIPPDGKPIIAGLDAQTTGGYPRIGQVIKTDLSIIGQLLPGDTIQFQYVTLAQASDIYAAQKAILADLFTMA